MTNKQVDEWTERLLQEVAQCEPSHRPFNPFQSIDDAHEIYVHWINRVADVPIMEIENFIPNSDPVVWFVKLGEYQACEMGLAEAMSVVMLKHFGLDKDFELDVDYDK